MRLPWAAPESWTKLPWLPSFFRATISYETRIPTTIRGSNRQHIDLGGVGWMRENLGFKIGFRGGPGDAHELQRLLFGRVLTPFLQPEPFPNPNQNFATQVHNCNEQKHKEYGRK